MSFENPFDLFIKLVDRLSTEKSFVSSYYLNDRRWFSVRIIHHIDKNSSGNLEEAEFEKKAKRMIREVKVIVNNNKDFSIGINTHKIRAGRRRRVQILYQAIGENLEFLTPSNLDYLVYIARRRYRTITRMLKYVNPNANNYFHYPHNCKNSNANNRAYKYILNNKAEIFFWNRPKIEIKIKKDENGEEKIIYDNSRDWKLNSSVDPVEAVNKFFIKGATECKANLVDCPVAIALLLLDALLESKEPNTLLKAMINDTINEHNIKDYPLMEILWRKSLLYDKVAIHKEELQIGDHLYIYNHPLYLYAIPKGPFQGEHAIVAEVGREIRLNQDKNKLKKEQLSKHTKFSGHGMEEKTIIELYVDFLDDINNFLSYTAALALAHLDPKVKPFTKTEETERERTKYFINSDEKLDDKTISDTYELFLYKGEFAYLNYIERKTGIRVPKTKVKKIERFVVAHAIDGSHFYIERVDFKDNGSERYNKSHHLKFKLKNTQSTNPSPEDWVITYLDKATKTIEREFPIFQRFKGTTIRKNLTFSELPINLDQFLEAPFLSNVPKSFKEEHAHSPFGVFVTRPKISFDTEYLEFLKNKGAIN